MNDIPANETPIDPVPEDQTPLSTQDSATKRAADIPPLTPDNATKLAGESRDFINDLSPYLPQDLVGGAVPHIPGTEDDAVWNAAAQACGTEKVHYVYAVDNGRVWYLACPTSALSSHPDTWCPLAAALPGGSEFWDTETVYLYEQEGIASALRWDPDTGRLQVFLGASRTILPRIQSMDANFVTINPEGAGLVPWRNRQLRTERLTRATVRTLSLSGLGVIALSVLLILFSFASINVLQRDLDNARIKTEDASMSLMTKATNVMQSDSIRHLVRVQELLDTLTRANGTLVKYQVERNKVAWEALVPEAFASKFGRAQGIDKDGRTRVVGNR